MAANDKGVEPILAEIERRIKAKELEARKRRTKSGRWENYKKLVCCCDTPSSAEEGEVERENQWSDFPDCATGGAEKGRSKETSPVCSLCANMDIVYSTTVSSKDYPQRMVV